MKRENKISKRSIIMKKWPLIQENDIVDIIAPASSAKYNLTKVQDFIKALGLVPRIADDIIDDGSHHYIANSNQYRFDHLRDALYAEDSRVIWCLRGGYGSMNLIPELSKLESPTISKAFIGFSDITALHIFFNQQWNWPTIHGKMIAELSENYNDDLVTSFKNLLFKQEIPSYDLIPMNDLAKSHQSIKSQIIGGNLCLVENSLATNWQINASGKILFLEEVGEKPYRIDRSFDHLRQAGIFDNVLAIILGAFDYDDKELMQYTLSVFIKTLDIPVLSMPYIGHNVENPPLTLGADMILNLGEAATLESNNITYE
jgi:muramoyltetrapeptide carboxypeptidase